MYNRNKEYLQNVYVKKEIISIFSFAKKLFWFICFCASDPGCISNITSSTQWLQNNVGGFSVLLSIKNIKELYPQFSAVCSIFLCILYNFFHHTITLSFYFSVFEHADGSPVSAVSQTACRGSFHTRPAHIC